MGKLKAYQTLLTPSSGYDLADWKDKIDRRIQILQARCHNVELGLISNLQKQIAKKRC